METITGGRQTGKTTKAIEIAAEKFAYIVCRSQPDAFRIAERAREMGLDIPFPITYDEVLQGRARSTGIQGYVYDDARDFLQRLSSRPVFAAVWGDDEPIPQDTQAPAGEGE